MPKIYDSKYINKTSTREYNAFAEEYLCGTDISLEINNKVVNAAAIDYTLQEQLKPIYGYASRVYDDIAVGSRIVVGTLLVPIENKSVNEEFSSSVLKNPLRNVVVGEHIPLNDTEKRILELRNKTNNNSANCESSIIVLKKGVNMYISPYSKNKLYALEVDTEVAVLNKINSFYMVKIIDDDKKLYVRSDDINVQ